MVAEQNTPTDALNPAATKTERLQYSRSFRLRRIELLRTHSHLDIRQDILEENRYKTKESARVSAQSEQRNEP